MEFSGLGGLALLLGAFVVLAVAMQLAGEGLILSTGVLVLRLLSLGRLKLGERRNFSRVSPKMSGNFFCYYENGECYVYQNFASLVGLAVWLIGLACLSLLKLGKPWI